MITRRCEKEQNHITASKTSDIKQVNKLRALESHSFEERAEDSWSFCTTHILIII